MKVSKRQRDRCSRGAAVLIRRITRTGLVAIPAGGGAWVVKKSLPE
jgi:hypothetical protein